MKIYLIDDTKKENKKGEYQYTFLDFLDPSKYTDHLTHIGEMDPLEDISFLQDAGAILIHSSFKNATSNSSGDVARIKELAYQCRIPIVEFSGGNPENKLLRAKEDKPERGRMNKKIFYSRLQRFVDICVNENRIDLGGLVKGKFKDSEMLISSSSPENLELLKVKLYQVDDQNSPDLKDGASMKNFLSGVKSSQGVLFDLDSLDPINVRYLSLNIRLSVYDLHAKVLCPLIFSGNRSWEEYLREYISCGCADIFICAGSYFMKKDDFTSLQPSPVKNLSVEEYREGFLNIIKVSPLAEVGNHTIANDYGAYILARFLPEDSFTGSDLLKIRNVETKDILYLKYLLVSKLSVERLNNIIENETSVRSKKISLPDTNGKRILFIDDQDKEWSHVMKAFLNATNSIEKDGIVIQGCKLDIIGKSNGLIGDDPENNYLTEEAKNILENSEKYDLIILDLRLGGVLEEANVNSEAFSGMKVLKKIMERNEGQQVIMFTSSNKAWNMQTALIDYNAADYYIKESPELLKSETESRNNLKMLVKSINHCLDNSYLRFMVRDLKDLRSGVESGTYNLSTLLLNETDLNEDEAGNELELILEQLQIALNLHLQAVKRQERNSRNFSYAVFALEQVFEIVRKWSPVYKENPNFKLVSFIREVLEMMGNFNSQLRNEISDFITMRNRFVHRQSLNEAEDYREIPDPESPKSFKRLWDAVMKFLQTIKA